MLINDLTLLAYTVSNSFRIFAYIPQIVRLARDKSGCAAISCPTWAMLLAAHVTDTAYAIFNVGDAGMATLFTGHALCCIAILAVAYWKRHGQASGWRYGSKVGESGPLAASLIRDTTAAVAGPEPHQVKYEPIQAPVIRMAFERSLLPLNQ